MNELLELALSAHGGLDGWKRIRSIDVPVNWPRLDRVA
jgi:hypothetical protein